jgi:translation initiation factor IF-2
VKRAGTNNQPAVFGFGVRADSSATSLAERLGVTIETFDIIYKLAERVTELALARTPKIATEEITGKAKVLKVFSAMKDKQVAGGRVEEGTLAPGNQCHIVRRGERIGKGKILGLQQQKSAAARVASGEFGMEIQSKFDVAAGDSIECFIVVEK